MKNKTLKSFAALAIVAAVSSNASSSTKEFNDAINAIKKIQEIEYEAKLKQLELEKIKKAPVKVENTKSPAQLEREKKEQETIKILSDQLKAYIEMLDKESKLIVAQTTINSFKTLQIGQKEYVIDENVLNNAIELVDYLVKKRNNINIISFFAKKALETNDKLTLSNTLNTVKSEFKKIITDSKEEKLRNKRLMASKPISIKKNKYLTNNIFLKIISDDQIVIYNKGK